jgi:hypothetical protein
MKGSNMNSINNYKGISGCVCTISGISGITGRPSAYESTSVNEMYKPYGNTETKPKSKRKNGFLLFDMLGIV